MTRKSSLGVIVVCLILVSPIFVHLTLGSSHETAEETPSHEARDGFGGSAFVQLMEMVSSSDIQFTSGSSFQDIPGMQIAFTAPRTACVVAIFSGEFFGGDFLVGLRALLDGNPMEPLLYRHDVPEDTLTVATPVFWRCGVPSGAHVLRIQWRAEFAMQIGIEHRSLVVQGGQETQ